MGFVKDRSVVVRVVDSQDDLGDGGEPSLVLGRDVQDVGGQRLHLVEKFQPGRIIVCNRQAGRYRERM